MGEGRACRLNRDRCAVSVSGQTGHGRLGEIEHRPVAVVHRVAAGRLQTRSADGRGPRRSILHRHEALLSRIDERAGADHQAIRHRQLRVAADGEVGLGAVHSQIGAGHDEALAVGLLGDRQAHAPEEPRRPVLVCLLAGRREHEVLLAVGGSHQFDTGALDDRVRVKAVDDRRGDRVHTLLDSLKDHRGEPDESERQPEAGDSLPPWPPEGTCRGRCRLPARRRPSSADSPLLGLDGGSPRFELVAVLVHHLTLSGLPDVGNG